MKRLSTAIVVSFLVLAGAAGTARALDVTTVKGNIESASGDSIYVSGRYYDVSEVPLTDPSGDEVPAYELRRGRKVEIFFERGRIKSILVFDENMLE